MRLNDVVTMIRGPRGTTVRLEVVPAGQAERTIYTIVRDEIKLVDQEARSVIVDERRDGLLIAIPQTVS